MTSLRLGLLAVLLIAAGAIPAWLWQANHYQAELATQQASHQADLTRIANANAAAVGRALDKQVAAQQALATLDETSTKERTDALEQNETLRRELAGTQADVAGLRAAVADGTRRLRIAGRCTTAAQLPGAGGQASATGLDDGSTVELSAAAGQNVFDIRAGIIRDQAALKGLQQYVRDVCLK